MAVTGRMSHSQAGNSHFEDRTHQAQKSDTPLVVRSTAFDQQVKSNPEAQSAGPMSARTMKNSRANCGPHRYHDGIEWTGALWRTLTVSDIDSGQELESLSQIRFDDCILYP